MNEAFYLIAFVGVCCGGFLLGFAIQFTYIYMTQGKQAAKQFFKEEF